jgi:reactive intermediate/imine deaminase
MKNILLIAGACAGLWSGVVSAAGVVAEKSERGNVEFFDSGRFGDLPFSEGVRVGKMLFLSGEIGETADGKLVPGGIQAEAAQALENIKASLAKQGYRMSDVVKCTAFLADMAEWPAFNVVYKSYFSKPYPARSAFGATGLAYNARVELECIAAK